MGKHLRGRVMSHIGRAAKTSMMACSKSNGWSDAADGYHDVPLGKLAMVRHAS